MRILKHFLPVLLIVTMLTMIIVPGTVSGALDTSTTSELTLNQEKTIINTDTYVYTIELTNLDACDKVLSVDFTCIPSIAVTINQKDRASGEILHSETVEHLNFGVHDVSISYQELTITSLNVLNIFFIDNQAKVELTYTTDDVAQPSLRLSTYRTTFSTTANDLFTLKLIAENSGNSAISATLSVTEMAGADYVLVGATKLDSENSEKSVTLDRGSNEISIQFSPLEVGTQSLSLSLGGVSKTIEITVLPSSGIATTTSSLSDFLDDGKIMDDVKMDLVYLFGFSVVLLVLSGVLIFISNPDNRSR